MDDLLNISSIFEDEFSDTAINRFPCEVVEHPSSSFLILQDNFVHETPNLTIQQDEDVDKAVSSSSSESDDENVDVPNIDLLGFSGDLAGSLVGVKAKKWEELFHLYKNHSNANGFGVKKSTEHKYKNGMVSGKYFLRRCQGRTYKAKDKATSTPLPVGINQIVIPSPIEKGHMKKIGSKRKRRHNIHRTGCKALMRVKYIKKEDLYKVVLHQMEHNHEFTKTYWNHFKRSERIVSEATGSLIEQFVEAGIKTKHGYNALVKAAGGEENVGHTRKDYSNFAARLKNKKIERGDAQYVLDRLKQLKKEDPDFYYDTYLGEGSVLEGIYWRDSMMKKDFDLFGKLMIFDTTYNTNRYNLICTPFVGINNHWNTVMFGCAFISNETEKTFDWLFRQFETSMDGKVPETIFTDQDQAMANAIKAVFGNRTRHRLCLWHIKQNAQGHFGTLKGDDEFKEWFDSCLMGCTNELEFEQCWGSTLDKYNLRDHSWFKHLYDIREKWCPALSKDFFSAGILSSQRSESTNHAICFDANRTTSLTDFFDIFNKTVQRWRSLEQRKEFESINTKPHPQMYGGLIRHAAEVYTLEIFKFFEKEVKASFAARYHICQYSEHTITLKVAHENTPEKFQIVEYKLTDEGVQVDCSCNHFAEVGLLSFHCIKALNFSNIDYIPGRYIVKRWTKRVKMDVWNSTYQGKITSATNLLESMPWRQLMSRKYHDLIVTCQDDSIAKRILEDSFNTASLQIQEHLSSKTEKGKVVASSGSGSGVVEVEHLSSTAKKRKTAASSGVGSNVAEICDDEDIVVLDPVRVNTKGRKKSIKSKFDRNKPLNYSDFDGAERNKHLI